MGGMLLRWPLLVSQSPTLPSFISGIAPWHDSNEASNYMVFLTGGYLLRNRNPQGDWNGTHIHTTNPSSPAKGMKRRENNGKKNRRIRMVMPQLWHGQVGMGWRHGESMWLSSMLIPPLLGILMVVCRPSPNMVYNPTLDLKCSKKNPQLPGVATARRLLTCCLDCCLVLLPPLLRLLLPLLLSRPVVLGFHLVSAFCFTSLVSLLL